VNKRDYLRSLGFEVGERGRFSAEMQEALKSFVETDKHIESTRKVLEQARERIVLPPRVKQREDSIYCAVLEGGTLIRMGMCSDCRQSCVWCMCDGGPQPPRYLDKPIVSWYPERSTEGALC
jgi:hypothetical protein